MGNEIKVCGTQNFMGIEIPVVEGGFGKECKIITDRTAADIHGMKMFKIRERIKDNLKRFKENVDYMDAKRILSMDTLLKLGYSKQSITQAGMIFLLSERGYSKLIKIMDSDKAWEIHDKLIDEYFSMRAELSSIQQQKAMLLLTIYGGGQDAVVASKELSQIEVKEATAPLTAENERKQEIINGFTGEVPIYQKPDIINRICRKSQGGYANRYKELYKCFKENFHADLVKRCENYNEKQPKKKDQLTIIRFAEKFGYIDDLYTCCAKLYESEIQEVLKELNELHK